MSKLQHASNVRKSARVARKVARVVASSKANSGWKVDAKGLQVAKRPFTGVIKTRDRKLSDRTINPRAIGVDVTWLSIALTCPDHSIDASGVHHGCPLKEVRTMQADGSLKVTHPCYAQNGNSARVVIRLDRAIGPNDTAESVAIEEAAFIRSLDGRRKFRTCVSGEHPTNACARATGPAMVEHTAKYGMPAWGYTHCFDVVDIDAWSGASILASCDRAEQVAFALSRGYATALTVDKHPGRAPYTYPGLPAGQLVLPCPAQFKTHAPHNPGADKDGMIRSTTCEQCSICQSPAMLRARKLTVGFAPDPSAPVPQSVQLFRSRSEVK